MDGYNPKLYFDMTYEFDEINVQEITIISLMALHINWRVAILSNPKLTPTWMPGIHEQWICFMGCDILYEWKSAQPYSSDQKTEMERSIYVQGLWGNFTDKNNPMATSNKEGLYMFPEGPSWREKHLIWKQE